VGAPSPEPVEASPTLADGTGALPPDAPRRTRKPRTTATTGLPTAKVPGLETAIAALPVDDEPRAMPSAPALATGPSSARSIVLVGCASSHPTTSIEEWAEGILHGARVDEKGTDHGHYLMVPYGGGPRYVASGIAAALADGRLVVPRRLAIPADHPVAPFLVPTLARYAEIVRGISR
jgi:hypothetical protein